MSDSKLIQGLVIAACLSLLVGIAVTAMEIRSYKKVKPVAAAASRPKAKTEEPAPPPANAPEPAAETPLGDTGGGD